MKTSKIKNVVSVKPHTNNYGTTYYHNLEMENGDKINLGKKKEQQIGWELTYEITEQGQQEFNKAKAVTPEAFKSNFKSSFKSNDNRQESIIRQSTLKCAVEYLKGTEPSLEEIFEAAEQMIAWVNKSEINKTVQEELTGRKQMDNQDQYKEIVDVLAPNNDNFDNRLKNQIDKMNNNDLPF